MKRQVLVSRASGSDPIVILGVDGLISADMHQELRLFVPSFVAALGQMQASAWYDDEDHSITIKRDVDAPPRGR